MHTRANDNYNLHKTENKSSPMPRERIREGEKKHTINRIFSRAFWHKKKR